MQNFTLEQAIQLLLPKIEKAKGTITASDAAAATGLSLEAAREALDALMLLYHCRLQVTQSGEILFNFGKSLERRGKITAKEIFAKIGIALWKTFVVVFKVWITVTLVFYFILFLLILLAILIASLAGNRDRDSKMPNIGEFLGDLLGGAARASMLMSFMDSDGYAYKDYRQTSRKDKTRPVDKKPLVQSVYDFVFGPKHPEFDPLANEKEVAAYLRENKGLISIAELIALAGLTYSQAEDKMTEYLSRFKGEPKITEDGVIVGNFNKMLAKGDSSLQGGKIELFWNEYEAPFLQTGNTTKMNAIIFGMNIFNLLFSVFMIGAFSQPIDYEMEGEGVAVIVMQLFSFIDPDILFITLGIVPMIFSFIFFLVPMLRMFVVNANESKRKQRNKRRRIIRVLFAYAGMDLTLQQIVNSVNTHDMKAMQPDEVESILKQLLIDLQGELLLNEKGEAIYRFNRLHNEISSVKNLRKSAVVDTGLGGIVFDGGK